MSNQDSTVQEKYSESAQLVKADLIKTITSMLNEFDVAFDYIDKDTLSKAKDVVSSMSTDQDTLDTFVKDTLAQLQEYSGEMASVVLATGKLKSSSFNFLSNVRLLQVDFENFVQENKNTKKTLVNYLYNIYMACLILSFNFDSNVDLSSINTQMQGFIDQLKDQVPAGSSAGTQSVSRRRARRQMQGNGGSSSGIDQMMSNIFGNSNIMEIATDISRDLEKEKIDPLTLMSSIVSQRPNAKLNNLLANISNKIENKINSGELDKEELEKQAQSVLNNVQNLHPSGNLVKSLLNQQNFKK